MKKKKFEWGPLSRGIYMAMLWLTFLVVWVASDWLFYYLGLLLFLGFGLRPLLERTGLYDLLDQGCRRIGDARWKRRTEERRLEVERKQRDDKYRFQRRKDPRLPRNW